MPHTNPNTNLHTAECHDPFEGNGVVSLGALTKKRETSRSGIGQQGLSFRSLAMQAFLGLTLCRDAYQKSEDQ